MRIPVDLFKLILVDQGLVVDSFIEHDHQNFLRSSRVSDEDLPDFPDDFFSIIGGAE